jgi:hypothetical protein
MTVRGAVAAWAFATGMLAVSPWARGQEVIDRIVAVAAGDLITLSDVRAARELGTVDPGAATDAEVRSRLIDRALMLDEVERYAPPDPRPEAVDAALAAVRRRFESAAGLERALARAGLDEVQLREMLRQDLRIRAYLDSRFAADTPERGAAMAAAWIAGLRRRATILEYP